MQESHLEHFDVVIVGAGFTGLSAAYKLSKNGLKVKVLEADSLPGGLAGTFEFSDGVKLEKFYHHWFNNDIYVPKLVEELGLQDKIVTLPTQTGMYFNGRHWKLSTPLDLLRFKALTFINRIRLGLLVLRVRRIKDWRTIEHLSIREWLEPLCGKDVFNIVWEPLISSKFSIYAEKISAVWMWKKLMLRGGTRNKKGGEELAYFKGGFGKLSDAITDVIRDYDGSISYGAKVIGINSHGHTIDSVITEGANIKGKYYIFTPALPIIACIFKNSTEVSWLKNLKKVNYLGNKCLVLRLKASLSETYWLNVNDPGFPFVGVIEHTNFDKPENYKGSHIVYLSRYLAIEDPLWEISDKEYFEFALESLKKMFPELNSSWVLEYYIWRTKYAQPITEKNYSNYVPTTKTPYKNSFICTMAQIYPEDRGTNYAIREGFKIASEIINDK